MPHFVRSTVRALADICTKLITVGAHRVKGLEKEQKVEELFFWSLES